MRRPLLTVYRYPGESQGPLGRRTARRQWVPAFAGTAGGARA
jgi:hypothetical protein